MTISDAVCAALTYWATTDLNFNPQNAADLVGEKAEDAIEEWMAENGYVFDEDACEWRKP